MGNISLNINIHVGVLNFGLTRSVIIKSVNYEWLAFNKKFFAIINVFCYIVFKFLQIHDGKMVFITDIVIYKKI